MRITAGEVQSGDRDGKPIFEAPIVVGSVVRYLGTSPAWTVTKVTGRYATITNLGAVMAVLLTDLELIH